MSDYLWNVLKNTPAEIQNYKNNSSNIIDNINNVDVTQICSKKRIQAKISALCDQLGLGGNGVSRYDYFSPLSKNAIVQLRISDHEGNNPYWYNIRERKGKPNYRHIIIFEGNSENMISQSVQEEKWDNIIVLKRVFIFPIYFLDDYRNVNIFLKILRNMFNNGSVIVPTDFYRPDFESYKRNTKNKLTESQFYMIINKSVKTILREYYNVQVLS